MGEDKISGAAILLFGKNPQRFFPRAQIRFIRYEGTSAQVGSRMNVIKDVKFKGKILDQVRNAINYIKTQIREYTKLGEGAVFQTIPEYPEFCWSELIVNAGAHRDYSIKGTDIQVKMFDDHFVVESPGILPGFVRINNIREFHFSRNPKIVELLSEYDLVKEFGEGVDRIFNEMEEAGLPDPYYRQNNFMLYAELRNKDWHKELSINNEEHTYDYSPIVYSKNQAAGQATGQATGQAAGQATGQAINLDEGEQKLIRFCEIPRSREEMMRFLGIESRSYFRNRYLNPMIKEGILRRTIPDKATSPKQKYVAITR